MKFFMQKLSNNFYVLREDLLPLSFGGNKYRIGLEFLNDMKKKKKNLLIGYGSSKSNLCRILSTLCKIENIPCVIISPIENDGMRIDSNNSLLSNISCAKYIYCNKNDVAETIKDTIEDAKKKGYEPYYINGDIYGHGNEITPIKAYLKVYKMIKKYEFDYIFLPTGTGMTQAGLVTGQILNQGNEKIVGISISRKSEIEIPIIKNYVEAYFKKSIDSEIFLCDDYLFGGYGRFDKKLTNFILDFYNSYGIQLDPTYTGKGLYGAFEYIKKNKINDKKILFIHTGGTPLFFDFIDGLKFGSYNVKQINDFCLIKDFIVEMDRCFLNPICKRVIIDDYINKVLLNGVVLGVEEKNEIKSLVMFYCNDNDNKTAYITYLATKVSSCGKKYASRLLEEVEKYSIAYGMKYIKLDTDKDNKKAIILYTKMDYKIIAVSNKITMVKEL